MDMGKSKASAGDSISQKCVCSDQSPENMDWNTNKDVVSEAHEAESFQSPVDNEMYVKGKENPQLDFDMTQCPEIMIGMEIATHEEAWDMYLRYARYKGFGVRKHSTFKSQKNSNLTIGRMFVCDREGKKNTRRSKNGTDDKVVKRKRETRTGCRARMGLNLNQETGTWRVGIFDDNHNHEFSPSEAFRHRSHKKYYERITPLKLHKEIGRQRQLNIGEEGISIVRHFQDQRNEGALSSFFMEIKEDYTLGSVFWADAHSRMAYLEFGDVVSFDIIYTGNGVNLPFAVFSGVNHHMQTTLFGCAMLGDETEDTFAWVFTKWLECMFGKAPGAIITNKDVAICGAIKRVLPHSRCCYSSVSIHKRAMEHLGLLRSNNTEFVKDYNLWLRSESVHKSERLWEIFKAKYDSTEINWLLNMYAEREYWVPAYLSDVFTAGRLQWEQQSENVAFFDGYVNLETPLGEFLNQYYEALTARRKAEKDEDFLTINSRPQCASGLQWEKQASRCYTRKMFDIFHCEFVASEGYYKEKIKKEGGRTEYIVGKCGTDKSEWRTVVLDVSGGVTFTCSCAKFETEGLLCRHILAIMRLKQIITIPNRYILRRWTSDARISMYGDSHLLNKELLTDAGITPVMRFLLQAKHEKLLECASSSLPLYNSYKSWLDEQLGESDSYFSNNELSMRSVVTPVMRFLLQSKHQKLLEYAASCLPLYNFYNSWLDEQLAELRSKESIPPAAGDS